MEGHAPPVKESVKILWLIQTHQEASEGHYLFIYLFPIWPDECKRRALDCSWYSWNLPGPQEPSPWCSDWPSPPIRVFQRLSEAAVRCISVLMVTTVGWEGKRERSGQSRSLPANYPLEKSGTSTLFYTWHKNSSLQFGRNLNNQSSVGRKRNKFQ